MNNLGKLFLITSLILACFMAVSGVCAADISDNNLTSVSDVSVSGNDSVSMSVSCSNSTGDVQVADEKNLNEVSTVNDNIKSSTNNEDGSLAYYGETYYVSKSGSDDNPGTSSSPFLTIGKAIAVADSGATIYIGSGNYTDDYDFQLNDDFTFIGDGPYSTIIDVGNDYLISVYEGATVTFKNIGLVNGYSDEDGGAISNWGGTVNVYNCYFADNYAERFGGAIYNEGTLNVNGCYFEHNYADARGGAIYNYNAPMGVESSEFFDNLAQMEGAAISNVHNYNIGCSINNCEFDENEGSSIETICNKGGLMVLTNSWIHDNDGKGLYNYANGDGNAKVTMNNCYFTDNAGCAISNGNTYSEVVSTCNIQQCIIAGNNGGISNNQGTSRNIANRNLVYANYNVIYDNGVNIYNSEYYGKTSRVNAQYNWWGSNSGASGISGSTVNVNNPVVLTLSPSAGSTINGQTSIITAYLNKYRSGSGLVTLSKSIPERTAYFTTSSSTGTFSSTDPDLLDSATVSYNAGSSSSATVTVNVDNQDLSLTVLNYNDDRESSFLSANKFVQPYLAGQNFTGKLVDKYGNPIIGQHIALNLTRLSNGLSKVYWVTTDTLGEYQLQINLGVGEYTAQCSYGGNSRYQPSTSGNTITVTRY